MTQKPQFSPEAMYIPPMKAVRRFDEDGAAHYEALTYSDKPTGVEILDALARALSAGKSFKPVLQVYGITVEELSTLCSLLLGKKLADLEREVHLRLADDLLRYTNLLQEEVAQRSGLINRQQLAYMYRRWYKCTPDERRRQLRRPRDVGRYRF
ncbi:MAG: helix-turn-helix transcriptional regulator [Bacteroides sp.]|nr:helix-turn-helix transcriptional regulator [Bacteroides sp.]